MSATPEPDHVARQKDWALVIRAAPTEQLERFVKNCRRIAEESLGGMVAIWGYAEVEGELLRRRRAEGPIGTDLIVARTKT